jgi:glucose/arabinose dehydrogenase
VTRSTRTAHLTRFVQLACPTRNQLRAGSALVAVSLLVMSLTAHAEPKPLENPIPKKIAVGDIKVATERFVRVPRTRDTHDRPMLLKDLNVELGTSAAYARLQYLLPIRDGTGRLVISDLRGLLYVVDASGKNLATYLDLRKATDNFADGIFPNEAGLLGFAFHPEFGQQGKPGYGKFYTAYSATVDSGKAAYLEGPALTQKSVIKEWTANDSRANVFAGASRELFRAGQFSPNHNIGTLAFNHGVGPGSPDYGMLYVCMGDGGGAYDTFDYGQSLAEPLGALMRIDPLGGGRRGRAYGIPADNPFVGRSGVAEEIWAYGLRHPQQFSFDTDGRLFINDIGQNHVEEVNIGVAGANYGWRVREGTFATGYDAGIGISASVFKKPRPARKYTGPVAQYDHDEGNAIGSGFVYRGSAIPSLRGKYVAADIVLGRLFYFDVGRLRPGKPAKLRELQIEVDGKTQSMLDAVGYENSYARHLNRADLRMGIDDAGELYLVTKGDGWVRKIVPAR